MFIDNKEQYRNLLISKAEMENWEIVIESEKDKKLYDMLIGGQFHQKKQKKKKTMESLVFIVFGQKAVDSLLTDGFQSYVKYKSSKKKSK